MFGLIESEWGIIIIVAVVVLVFGGSQLPKLARSLGSAQSEFKKGLAEGKGESTTPATDSTAASESKGSASDGGGSSAATG